MKRFLILIIILSSGQMQANSLSFYVSELLEIQCGSDIITVPTNIEIYQTEDDTPFGEKELICIGVRKDSWKYYIDVKEVDISKPLFFRHKIYQTPEDFPLTPNFMYNVQSVLNGEMEHYIFDEICEGADCTRVIIGDTRPNEEGTGLSQRYVDVDFGQQCDISACMATQNFEEGQFINDVIIQVRLSAIALEAGEIRMPSLDIWSEDWIGANLISENVQIPEYSWDGESTYNLSAWELFDYDYRPIIFQYTQNDYPSDATRQYIEFIPEINKDITQKINIELEEASLLLQDFVTLRGGLVEGSTERHNLNLDLSNPLCLFFVEVAVGGNTHLNFMQGSHVDLFGDGACIQLREGAKMNIVDNHHLFYGRNGKGNIAIRDDSKLTITTGALMTFDGFMMIDDYDKDPSNDKANIILEPGSSLIFTKDARVRNFHEKEMTLDIYMNGGSLDMQELDAKSKALIRLIYPDQEMSSQRIYPNPALDYIQISNKSEEVQNYQIRDLQGSLVQSGKTKGSNPRIEIEQLEEGIYFIELQSKQGNSVSKFVKL